jgi:hypothetical protein
MSLDNGLISFLAAPGLSLSPVPNGLPALTHGAFAVSVTTPGWPGNR